MTADGRRELVLIGKACEQRWRRLPVMRMEWMPDRLRCTDLVVAAAAVPERSRSPITLPGHNKGIKPPNWKKRFPASPPSPEEMLRLLDAAMPKPSKRGYRNRALLTTLWRSGLRVSEALALLPHDVDFQNKTVTVMAGKGGKRRVSGIDAGGLLEISRWLMVRAVLEVPEGSPLFCTVNRPTQGNPVHAAYVRELCRVLRFRARIPHRVAPHQLRHAHAVELARERVPVPLISRQLGHSNVATTATYLTGIAPQEVIDVVSVRVWPGGDRAA